MRYILILIILLGVDRFGHAEEETNFFGLSKVSFFRKKQVKETKKPASESENQQNTTLNTNTTQTPVEDDWTEPVIDTAGKVTLHTPPAVVKNFVENPSPENADVYLEWNTKRVEKLFKAQEALVRAIKKREAALQKTSPAPVVTAREIPGIKEKHVVYFMLKGCSACKQQSAVIEQIHAEHPEVFIEAFGKGYTQEETKELRFPAKPDMGISKLFGITTFPSMLVFNKKGEKYFIYGFKEKKEILKLLR